MKIHETVWNQIEACWIEFGESVFSTENKYEDEYRLEDEKADFCLTISFFPCWNK